MIWLIPIGILGLYLLTVKLSFGTTPDSISQTAKLWTDRGRKRMFPIFVGAVGISTAVISVVRYDKGLYKDGTGAALLLAGICVAFLALFLSQYWKKDVIKPHIAYTIALLTLGMAGVVNQILPNWKAAIPVFVSFVIAGLIKRYVKKSQTYWIEIDFIAAIFLTLIFI